MRYWAFIPILCSCTAAPPGRLPHIAGASPTGTGISPDRLVAEVTFSEPVDPAGVEDGRRLALCRAADQEQVAVLVDSTEGITTGAPVVTAKVALVDEGRRAELQVVGPLEPLTRYAIVVGSKLTAGGRPVLDPEGRRRVFVLQFETGLMPDRAPPAARWALPPHGPVPRNLRSLEVSFDEPVTGELVLNGVPSAQPSVLGPQLLGLQLQAPLEVESLAVLLENVRDAVSNQAQGLEPLPVSACEDWLAPVIDEANLTVTMGELGLNVDADTGELARLGVEVQSPPEEQACGTLPQLPQTLVTWGEMLPCRGVDPCGSDSVRCALAASVSGLCPDHRLLLRVAAEDLAGNRSPWGPWREAATLPGVARPVITEVLVDAAAPEAGGEYLELANMGTADADLTGYTLAKRTASGALTRCSLEPLAGPMPPGALALVVGGAYDGRYSLPAETALYRCGSTALVGGLANARAPALQLEAPGGEVQSSFGMAAPALRCAGRAVERVHPAGPDATENFVCTSSEPGTPGVCNSGTPAEECPRRPW